MSPPNTYPVKMSVADFELIKEVCSMLESVQMIVFVKVQKVKKILEETQMSLELSRLEFHKIDF